MVNLAYLSRSLSADAYVFLGQSTFPNSEQLDGVAPDVLTQQSVLLPAILLLLFLTSDGPSGSQGQTTCLASALNW